ncbi:MAG: ABC transporter ATP-binding protein [Candidatus Dormibacteraceae bacterium]
MSATRLSATEVGYRIANRFVLEGICIEVAAGQSLAVTGPSGAGKTTLLHLLAGVLRPTKGRVMLDDSPLPARGSCASRIGLVLQNNGLVADLTAAENIALPLQARGLPRQLIGDRIASALAAVGLEGLGNHFADQLSGGQQQRVGLARALAGDPDVIIADEPTSELDSENRMVVVRLLKGEAARGKIVVVASHDADVAASCMAEVQLVGGRMAGGAMDLGRLERPPA